LRLFNFRPLFKKKFFLALFLGSFLAFPKNALADFDFYGTKMKSEDFARNILQEKNLTQDFINQQPGVDKRIYAFGHLNSFWGRSHGVDITVHNQSDRPLATERLLRECFVWTKDGKRYDQSQPAMEWRVEILEPAHEAEFSFDFQDVNFRTQDIQMIQLSFGLGETKIFLFPVAKPAPAKLIEKKTPEKIELKQKTPKEAPKAVSAPVKLTTSASLTTPKEVKKSEPNKETQKETPKKTFLPKGECVTPVKAFQSFFQGLGEKIVSANTPKPGQAASKPETKLLSAGTAKVIEVNPNYFFIVFNAGFKDGVAPNSIVSVSRHGCLVGKVTASKVRDDISAAVILPEWRTKDGIRVGDIVSFDFPKSANAIQ